ncbi:MAG TPA: alpha/beta hydrolase [Acidimicrobiales bacterium]
MADREKEQPPALPAGVRSSNVATNGVELRVLEAGQGFPVLMLHGFPELAFSWRHQLPVLAKSGFRAIAPDQRGYGRSSRPDDVSLYDIEHLMADAIGLLDALGHQKAVVVGHDWGSMVAWTLALRHPDRFAGVVGMSVPFVPRGELPPLQVFRQLFASNFFYILYFQEPGVADADLGADPSKTLRRFLAGITAGGDPASAAVAMSAPDGRGFVERLPEPDRLPDWLSNEELDVYVSEFARTGFTGGLNWYRNLDRNWELTADLAGKKIEIPSMFIGGASDPTLFMAPPSVMSGWVTDHRGDVLLAGAGHWVQQERAAEVNAELLDFMKAVAGT